MWSRTRDPRDVERENAALRYQLQEAEERDDQARRAEWRRREEEQARREEEAEARRRTASSWPEALAKQRGLFMREWRQFPDDPDTWFKEGADACERAQAIWVEVAAERQSQIAALEARIAALLDGIKNGVADRLETEGAAPGWREVARALREDDPTDWLNW